MIVKRTPQKRPDPRSFEGETPDQARLRKWGIDATKIFIRKGRMGFVIKGCDQIHAVNDLNEIMVCLRKMISERFKLT